MNTAWLKLLKEDGTVIENTHVKYSPRMHGSVYINEDAIYPFPRKVSLVCRAIADHFREDAIDVVIAPVVARVLSQWVAHHLSEHIEKEVVSLYADKYDGDFTLRTGYAKLVSGSRVLVIDDIVTTGVSTKRLIELVRWSGGQVVGAGVMWNRGSVTANQIGNIPKFVSLVDIPLRSWDPYECPLCKRGIPINKSLGYESGILSKKLLT